jgi:hypothetical protein
VQGLGRADMAQPILATMESRYPHSAQTQEVRWLLRPAPAVEGAGAAGVLAATTAATGAAASAPAA